MADTNGVPYADQDWIMLMSIRKDVWHDVLVSFWIVAMTGLYVFYGLSYLGAVQSVTRRFLVLVDRLRAFVW